MPEQITPLSILYLLLHGAGIAVGTVLCLYLLLCRGIIRRHGHGPRLECRRLDARRGIEHPIRIF